MCRRKERKASLAIAWLEDFELKSLLGYKRLREMECHYIRVLLLLYLHFHLFVASEKAFVLLPEILQFSDPGEVLSGVHKPASLHSEALDHDQIHYFDNFLLIIIILRVPIKVRP